MDSQAMTMCGRKLRRFGALCVALLLIQQPLAAAEAKINLADGFDFPVGKPNAEGYYKARGLRL
ncbi:MAG: hypothetical protein ACRDBP_09640, partial [Luteolibacter sp.]